MADHDEKTETLEQAPNMESENDVLSRIKAMFGQEVCSAFEREEINTEAVLADLVLKDADATIFVRLGLNYGKAVRLQKEFSHLRRRQAARASHSSPPAKPTMADLTSFSYETKQLYYSKRKKIGVQVTEKWGKKLPKFNTPESKAQLEEFANKLVPECGIPEIDFGKEGIAQHIKNFCNEQRRYNKMKKRSLEEPLSTEPKPKPRIIGKNDSSSEDATADEMANVSDSSASGDTEILSSEDDSQLLFDSPPPSQVKCYYSPPPSQGTRYYSPPPSQVTRHSSPPSSQVTRHSSPPPSQATLHSTRGGLLQSQCTNDSDAINFSSSPKSQEDESADIVHVELQTYQKMVKMVYGKVLGRDDLVKSLKNKFKVPAKNLTHLKPSELVACLGKKLIKSGYCTIGSDKSGKVEVIVHKEIEHSIHV